MLVSLSRQSERENVTNDRVDRTGVNQPGDFLQLAPSGLDDEKRGTGALVGCPFAGSGDGDEPSARLEHAPGPLQRLAAYRVEHHVDVPDHVLKPRALVVDRLVGPE